MALAECVRPSLKPRLDQTRLTGSAPEVYSYWDALCSQHFEYGSNYGHVTLGINSLLSWR